ncbi:hypothetical protein HBH92_084130 [Parastagonospora nodorum]|nr:hypothetical protein HBH92_084130 [Parastagonospora nodorum]
MSRQAQSARVYHHWKHLLTLQSQRRDLVVEVLVARAARQHASVTRAPTYIATTNNRMRRNYCDNV